MPQETVLHGGGRRASRREETCLTFMLCDFVVDTIRIAYANGISIGNTYLNNP